MRSGPGTCVFPDCAVTAESCYSEAMQMIRPADMSDLDALAALESECFPPAEAASRDAIADRLRTYADHFWLLFDDDRLTEICGFDPRQEPSRPAAALDAQALRARMRDALVAIVLDQAARIQRLEAAQRAPDPARPRRKRPA